MVPTFIVAGATKSGTTALGEYLNDHPQVCMSWMKEPNFFTEEIPVTRYKNGFSWYQSLFDNCGQAKAIGEVSQVESSQLGGIRCDHCMASRARYDGQVLTPHRRQSQYFQVVAYCGG